MGRATPAPSAFLGPCWAQVGAKLGPSWAKLGPSGPEVGPRWFQIGSKTGSKNMFDFEIHFSSIFDRFWEGFGRVLGAKLASKMHQKLDQDADQIFASFLIDLGTFFYQFCFEVGRPRNQKTLKNLRFFLAFLLFRPTCQQEAI